MITEDYVSFEVAKLLKEKGFEQHKCRHSYDSKGYFKWSDDLDPYECSAPTHQMAMKWLREIYNTDIDVEASVGMLGIKVYVPFISTYEPLKDDPSKVHQIKRGIYYKDDRGVIPALQHFDSYEEAVEAALKYYLEKKIA